ncbi:dihydroxyacetone kinase subunit DhaK [Humibacter albus]|uniref:dihydroxyacetone kinase subunit DhaK n=1 Tax=Humibacter albus TaxID=427754 RepID=UPI0003B442F6|nr:dihydroxyacetone kinase subunit DhaK [Humibacter albus]
MKKLLNDPRRFVADALAGFAEAHADIVRVQSSPVFVTRLRMSAGKVGVVSGGGSGHEPLHVGFVGHGMLDAAAPGEIFTSPTPDPILAATREAHQGAGVLYLVKNYTGDVLNFETAAELAAMEGIAVRTVVIDDDVAVQNSEFTAGRRGVAGTVLIEKIVGAAAERGDGLDALADLATRLTASVRSIGVAIGAPTVPHSGKQSFELAPDEIEFGIGIHGERGRARVGMAPADELADRALEAVLDDIPREGERTIVLVNGMGATPPAELYVVYRRIAERLRGIGAHIERSLVGSYVTSLDMAGFSVSLLSVDDELLSLWDAPVRTAALRWGM